MITYIFGYNKLTTDIYSTRVRGLGPGVNKSRKNMRWGEIYIGIKSLIKLAPLPIEGLDFKGG